MGTYGGQFTGRNTLESLEPRLLLAADWTFLVYIDADNNLESAGIDDINEMEVAGSTPEVNVVVQIDRYENSWDPWDDHTHGDWTDTRRGLIVQDNNTALINSTLTSIGEANMAFSTTLSSFIQWGASTYPAEHYALVVWDHGGGTYGVCWDDTNGGNMTLAGLRAALADSGVHLDVLAFDCCLMSMIETAHEIAPYADVMVASEETIAFEGYPYDTILLDLTANPGWSAAELGASIVNRYGQYYFGGFWGATLASMDLSQVPALTAAVGGLTDAILSEHADLGAASTAWNAAEYFGYDFSDLGTFLQEMLNNATNPVVQSAALDALVQYNTTVLDNFTDVLQGTGMSIYFPGPSDVMDVSYRASNFHFLADTSWRQFLNAFRTTYPELTVLDGATSITDGETTPIDFGTVLGSTPYVSRSFLLRNEGLVPLNLGTMTVPEGFAVEPLLATSLPPGGQVPLTVSLITDTPGSYSGDVTIVTNDWDENPFTFAISGQVQASGEVTVLYDGNEIADGQSVPVDFGEKVQQQPASPQIFTIRNDGLDDLVLCPVQAPPGYVVTQPTVWLLAPGETTTFALTLDTALPGARAGEVSFYNSDGDESPFSFAVCGTVCGPDFVVADVRYCPGPYGTGMDPVCLSTCLVNAGMARFYRCQSVQVEARLSQDTIWGNADDVVVYQGMHHVVDLSVGQESRPYAETLRTSFGGVEVGSYYLAVKINADGAVCEMDEDNNVWWSESANVSLYPTSLYTRLIHGCKVSFKDDSGHTVRLKYTGPGYVDIRTSTGRTYQQMRGDIQDIVLGETTEASQLVISAGRQGTRVGDIVVRGSIKAILGKGVTVTGDVTITGTAGKIVLGDIADSHTITIGSAGVGETTSAVNLCFGRVAETSLISGTAISSLTVTEWLDGDGTADVIEAPWIGALTSTGDRRGGLEGHFQAGLVLGGAGGWLGTVRIAGDLRQADWDIDGQMGSFTVGGTVADSRIRATRGMAAITIGAADGSDFLAGVKPTVGRHADSRTDFLWTSASIGSFRVRGLRDGGQKRWYFQNSNVTAARIGKVDLLNVNYDNGKQGFGFYALRPPTGGGIASVRHLDKVTGERWSWPWPSDSVMAIPDMEIALL